MTTETRYVVFPDGETQEISHLLGIDALVDLNGIPFPLPLRTNRIIAYRVVRIRRREERGELDILHYLELVPVTELISYCI